MCESESDVKANPSMAARWFTSIFIPQSHTHALCVSSCWAARAFAAPPAVTAKTFVYCFSASQQLRKIYILVLRTAYIQFKNGVRFSAAATTTTRRHAASQRGTCLTCIYAEMAFQQMRWLNILQLFGEQGKSSVL